MDALRLEVKKDQWRQNQGGSYKLTFTVNPTDLDDNAQDVLMDFFKAPMGAVYMLGAARVGDDGQPVAPEKPKKRFPELPLSQQAALRCQDENFWRFLRQRGAACDSDPVDQAAVYVRWFCDVKSRAELDDTTLEYAHCADKWREFNNEYEQWAGLTPEQR